MGQNASQLKELVPQLRTNIDDPDFQIEGMSKIADFARTDNSSRQLAIKYEAIQTVLASMEQHTSVRGVQAAGFDALTALLGGDAGGVGGDLDRANASLYLEDITDLALAAAKEFKKKGNVIQAACRTLSLLVETLKDEASSMLFDRDILHVTGNLAKANSKHADPLWGVFLLLGSLAMVGADERSRIAEGGALDQALSALAAHAEDAQVAWAVCRLIAFAVLGSNENKEAIVEKGGIPAVVAALKEHGESAPSVVEWACLALSNITAKSETYAVVAQNEGAVRAVAAAIRAARAMLADIPEEGGGGAQKGVRATCLNGAKNACFALAALMAKNEEARIVFNEVCIAGDIVELMLEHKMFAQLQQYAMAALANAAMYPQAITTIVYNDGIRAITKALKKHPTANGVQIEGSRAISIIVKNAPLILEEVKIDDDDEEDDDDDSDVSEEEEGGGGEEEEEVNDEECNDEDEKKDKKKKKKKGKKSKKKDIDEDEEEDDENEKVNDDDVTAVVVNGNDDEGVEKKGKKKKKKGKNSKKKDAAEGEGAEEENVTGDKEEAEEGEEEGLIDAGEKKKKQKKKKKGKKAGYEEQINSDDEEGEGKGKSKPEIDAEDDNDEQTKKPKKSKKKKAKAQEDIEREGDNGEGEKVVNKEEDEAVEEGASKKKKTKKSKKVANENGEEEEEVALDENNGDEVPEAAAESKKKRKRKKKKSKKRAKDEVEESLIQSMSQDCTSSVDEAASQTMSETVFADVEEEDEKTKKRAKKDAAEFIETEEVAAGKAGEPSAADGAIETDAMLAVSRPSLAAPIKEPVLFNELCSIISAEETYVPILSTLKSQLRDGEGHVCEKVLEALDNLLDSAPISLGKDCISGINNAMRDPESVCDGDSDTVIRGVRCHAVSILSKALIRSAGGSDRTAILKSNFVTWVIGQLKDLAGSDAETVAAYCGAAERIALLKLFNEDDKVIEAIVAAINSHKDRAEVIDAGLAAVASVCHSTQAPWAYAAAFGSGCVSLCVGEITSGKRAPGSALLCLYFFLAGHKDDALKKGCKDQRLVPSVIKAVRKHEDDRRVVGYGLSVLYLLAIDRDKAKRALVDGDALGLARDVIRKNCNVTVLSAAYRVIHVLAQCKEFPVERLGEGDLPFLLVDTLTLHGDTDEAFADVAYVTLANIATRSLQNSTALAKAGAVRCALCPLLGDPTAYERKSLVANAISLIGALSTMKNEFNKALIVRSGGVALIIRAMDLLDDNELVLKNGCSALGLLCYRYADKITIKKKDNNNDDDKDEGKEENVNDSDEDSGEDKSKKKKKEKKSKKKKHHKKHSESEEDEDNEDNDDDEGESSDNEEGDIESVIDAVCTALRSMPSSNLVQADGCRALGLLAHEQPAVARAVMEAGGLELVFAALKSSSMSVQVQESTTYALLCFATVSESEVHAAIAAEERLTDNIVAVARAYPQSTSIQKSVCLFLSTMEKEMAAAAAKKEGGDGSGSENENDEDSEDRLGLTTGGADKVNTPVALLVDTLRKNMDDQNIVCNTLKSLVYLLTMAMNDLKAATAADPALATKMPRGTPLAAFFAEGGVEVIVQVMNTFVTDVRVQEFCCAVFASFAESKPLVEEAVKVLLAEDACVIFIDAVRGYPTSATIQRAGCSILGMYCRSKVWTECVTLLAPTVVPLILQAITTFVADKNVLKACLLALFVMVTHSDALLQNIVNFGGVNIVVNCMLSCSTSAGVQEYGCLLLSNIALKGEQYVAIIATAGGITADIQALQAYAKFPGVQKNALQLMAVLTVKAFEENRINFASMGAIRLLKDAFANYAETAPIIRYALLAFANLAYSARAMRDVVPAEAAETLVGVLTRFEGTQQVVSEAVRALSKISLYPPVAKELLARGVVRALLSVIKKHSRVPLIVQYAAATIGCLAKFYVEKSVDEEALAKSLAVLEEVPKKEEDKKKKGKKGKKKGKKDDDDEEEVEKEDVDEEGDGKKKKKKKGKKKHGKEEEEEEEEVKKEDDTIGEIEENYFLGEKGIDLLIETFNASLNIIVVQEAIMRAIAEVSKTSKRDKAILEHKKNILKVVMDMILRFDKSEPVKATGFDVVAVFCANSEANAAKAVSLDGPRIIVASLAAMRNSPPVCKYAAKALAAIMGSAKEAAAIVFKADGLGALAGAMKQYPAIPIIQEYCCAALSRLVLAGESVAAAVAANNNNAGAQDGALFLAISAMKLHCIEPGVQAEGCALISSLAASSERCRELLVKANCHTTVIEALRKLPAPRVQENGCKALANIAACKDPACAILGINGGVKIVLAAMRKFPQNPAIQESCCLAIANMVARNEHCTGCVISENGVATIIAGMTELEANPMVQKNGCFAFAAMASKCSEPERAAIIAAGALPRVFYAMRQYPAADPIQRYGLLSLNNLAPPAAAGTAPWYIADESLGALAVTSVLGAMAGCPQQQFIQAEGCKTLLKFVGKSDKNALVALGNGGPRAILAALPAIPAAQTVTKAIMALSKLLAVAKAGVVPLERLDFVSVLLRCGIAFSGDENIAKAATRCFELLALTESDVALIVRAVKSNATVDPAIHFVVVVALQALTRQNPQNALVVVGSQPDAFVDAFATLLGTSGNKGLVEQVCSVLAGIVQAVTSASSSVPPQVKSLAQSVTSSQQRLGLSDGAVKPLLALL